MSFAEMARIVNRLLDLEREHDQDMLAAETLYGLLNAHGHPVHLYNIETMLHWHQGMLGPHVMPHMDDRDIESLVSMPDLFPGVTTGD